ncbi:conserved exported hypothetical protein [Tenacibaculum litoreum]|uniref:hypothetical protein n=1 Tax=Tenacibaculum TaxID=104267 RepID=UPI003895EA7A
MKKSIPFLLLLFLSFQTFSQIQAEKITPPTKGKSVIYFLRTTGLGALMNIRYFDKEQYLGRFNGVNYLRYECDPGEKVFWIKAENIDVLEANLEADKVYLVETNAVMGAFSAGAKFKLVDFNKKNQVKRINKLLEKKEPKTFTQETLNEQLQKMKDVVNKGLKKVRKKIERKKTTKLSPNMNYQV